MAYCVAEIFLPLKIMTSPGDFSRKKRQLGRLPENTSVLRWPVGYFELRIESQYTWKIPKLSLEIRNSNNYRRLPKCSPFPVFSSFQFPHFGLLFFFAVWSGFFAVSKLANTCKMTKHQKLFGGRKKLSQAIIPEQVIILHTLEDIYHSDSDCYYHVKPWNTDQMHDALCSPGGWKPYFFCRFSMFSANFLWIFPQKKTPIFRRSCEHFRLLGQVVEATKGLNAADDFWVFNQHKMGNFVVRTGSWSSNFAQVISTCLIVHW